MERIAHITETEDAQILLAAKAAKAEIMTETKEAVRQSVTALNDSLRSSNMQAAVSEMVYGGNSIGGFIAPVNGSRKARNKAASVRRGFCFTIEGREGIWKLHGDGVGIALSMSRVNGAWNGHSPNFYEQQYARA